VNSKSAGYGIHNPERHSDESLKQYRERQAKSRKAVQRVLAGHKVKVEPHAQRQRGLNVKLRKAMSRMDRGLSTIEANRRISGYFGALDARAAIGPKLAAERKHKPHHHPLRDEHGAITLIGKPYELDGIHPNSREVVVTGWGDGEEFGYTVQRKWLGGISAQRGF
jgi:hypothetical protein